MGDRSQIAVKHSEGKIYIYSHNGGKDIYGALSRALERKQRWNQPNYLTRIIFCEVVKGHEAEELGFGIDLAAHFDVEHPIPVVDCENQMITWEENDERYPDLSFNDFIRAWNDPEFEG